MLYCMRMVIIFLADQDDVWLPEKIEKTIQKQKETGADLFEIQA